MLGRANATGNGASAMKPEESQRYGGLVPAIASQARVVRQVGLPADDAASERQRR
jgi:hypothetical protein